MIYFTREAFRNCPPEVFDTILKLVSNEHLLCGKYLFWYTINIKKTEEERRRREEGEGGEIIILRTEAKPS